MIIDGTFIRKMCHMSQIERINNFYNELCKDDFIKTKGFSRFRFGTNEFYALASTLKTKNGREITVSFNIHDEAPEMVELVVQCLNHTTMEQVRIVGKKVCDKLNGEINDYQETGCISMVSYFLIEDISGVMLMFKTILEELGNVSVFMMYSE